MRDSCHLVREGLCACLRRKEKAFLSPLSVHGITGREGNFQLTQANVPDKLEEHFHFVFQLIFNHVQAK